MQYWYIDTICLDEVVRGDNYSYISHVRIIPSEGTLDSATSCGIPGVSYARHRLSLSGIEPRSLEDGVVDPSWNILNEQHKLDNPDICRFCRNSIIHRR